jgi:hypothetical protein
MVRKVKKESRLMQVCFQKDKRENQDWMEREHHLDHQEDRVTLALRDGKAKLVVRCV